MVAYLCSPGMDEVIPVFRSSLTNLDSLVTFYQQERTWARRIRAELREESQEDVDKNPLPPPPPLAGILSSALFARATAVSPAIGNIAEAAAFAVPPH